MSGNVGFIAAPDILLDVHNLLCSLSFPASPETNKDPDVYFLGTHHEASEEQIELMGTIKDGDIEWLNTGRIVGERFDIQIDVETSVRGQSGIEAIERVRDLAQVVETGLRDQTTGLPQGLTDPRIVNNYSLRGFDLETYPVDDTGWGARYSLVLRVDTRH